ncbi:MAG: cell division protein FtsQ/DivIB [Thiotrichales bacterium]|nr:MAG: cell division protein FtsQ/DivIB [Thiotrichales bacterium]
MGARRKQRKQNIGINLRRWSRPLLLLVVVAGTGLLLDRLPDEWMPIKNVQIEGTFAHLSRSDIQQQLTQELMGDYFTADIEKVRASLLTLPWVEDASIRRQWPSTLRIRIIERQAVAYWSDDALLSDKGDVFKPEQIDRAMQIPTISGPEGLHHKVWAFLVELHTDLSGLGLGVDKLVLDERRSWSMLLSNGVELRLGRNETERRIQRFVRVFSMQNAPKIDDIKYIDLRYPNGFAMKNKALPEKANKAGLTNVSGWTRHV